MAPPLFMSRLNPLIMVPADAGWMPLIKNRFGTVGSAFSGGFGVAPPEIPSCCVIVLRSMLQEPLLQAGIVAGPHLPKSGLVALQFCTCSHR